MVGLPFEEHADVEAIVTLTEQIRERMLQVARGRGRIGRIHPSVNPFVPEAGDALPVAADGGPEGDRPQAPVPAQGLRAGCRTSTRSARARARAPRSRSSPSATGAWRDALEIAATQGARLQARDARGGARPRLLPLPRPRPKDEVLPWDVVDNGVSKAYFWRELEKSRAGAALAALPGDPGLHPLRRLRRDAEPVLPAAREVEGPRGAAALREARRPRRLRPPALAATRYGCASGARRRAQSASSVVHSA